MSSACNVVIPKNQRRRRLRPQRTFFSGLTSVFPRSGLEVSKSCEFPWECEGTSLCSASYVSCKRDTARICCCVPCCCGAGRAAIDRYLLPAGPTAANPPHAAAAGNWDSGWTDTVPLHRPWSAYTSRAVPVIRSVGNRNGIDKLFWQRKRTGMSLFAKISYFVQVRCRV